MLPQRTYRHRNDQRQPPEQSVSNSYNRSLHSPQHNRAPGAYTYIANRPPSPDIHVPPHLPPNMPPSPPHTGYPPHLHVNYPNHIQNQSPQFLIASHQLHQRAHSLPHHHIHSSTNNAYHNNNKKHKYSSPRRTRNSNNTRYHRNRSAFNALYQNYNEQHRIRRRVQSKPPISHDILICIDNVGPQLIQYLPASTAYYLIEIIEPYLTNHNNDRIPLRRKSELLSKWHNSYGSQRRMKQYLDSNDILNRLYHFNKISISNREQCSKLCVWDISIKQSEIMQYFGTSRDLLMRCILSYIIMSCFLCHKHNEWFNNIFIKKELNVCEMHKFLVSKLQKIDDIKKFYKINPAISSNDYLLCLLNAFKSRFERDNFGGDTLLYCHSWVADKFETILNNLSKRYPMEKRNRKRMKKSAIYEFGFRSRLDRPIFGFYIGKHKGFNPRTKGIELKFNPKKNYSYFYDLKWLFLPEFIEDQVLNYVSFDVKWESDYTRGEQFKYFNLICADINCENDNYLYKRFKFVVWKGQYFDSDDNLLGQYDKR